MTVELQRLIFATLQRMNWNFGIGTLIGFNLKTRTAYREWPTGQYGRVSETRKFRFDGKTVYFLGHQETIVERKRNAKA